MPCSLGNVPDHGSLLEHWPDAVNQARRPPRGSLWLAQSWLPSTKQGLCSRGERWTLPEADSALRVIQAAEAVGERCLGDPPGIPQTGEEAWSWAVWGSLDG